MELKLELNIYQLPEIKLVAHQNVTGWGLEKILAFARDQLISYNRLCCLADDAGGDNISGHLKALYEAVPDKKSEGSDLSVITTPWRR